MTNDELIRDIEDSIRQERLTALWKEYGSYLIAGVLLAVLFTGLISGWRAWNDSTSAAATAVLLESLENPDAAASLSKIPDDLRGGPRALARLNEAALMLKDGKTDQALAVFEATRDDRATPPLYRDFATLMATRIGWDKNPDDTAGAQKRISALESVTGKGGPWEAQARLQIALIAAHSLKDARRAQAELDAVLERENVPPSLRERARALQQVYAARLAPEENTDKKPAPEPEG